MAAKEGDSPRGSGLGKAGRALPEGQEGLFRQIFQAFRLHPEGREMYFSFSRRQGSTVGTIHPDHLSPLSFLCLCPLLLTLCDYLCRLRTCVLAAFRILSWGTWAIQPVKHLTLDFSSGHDLMVCEFEPYIRLCTSSIEPAWNSLSPLSLSLSCSCSLSVSQNK